MANRPPAFMFYARDWLVDTARMTLEEEGAYARLLAHQWIEGPLPADLRQLARILGVGVKKMASLWATLGKHFPKVNADAIANRRLEDERRKQVEYREMQAKRGQASAKARFNRRSTSVQPE